MDAAPNSARQEPLCDLTVRESDSASDRLPPLWSKFNRQDINWCKASLPKCREPLSVIARKVCVAAEREAGAVDQRW
jgi:hypothetical protein